MLTKLLVLFHRLFKPFTHNKLLLIPLLFHLIQVLFISFNLKYAISPDEDHHFRVIELYSQTFSWRLQDTPESLKYGVLSVYPYLYHRLLGYVFPIFSGSLYALLALRLFNVLLSVGLFFATAHLCRRVTQSKLSQFLCLLVLASIPKLQLLSGAITYDNAINLLSAIFLLSLLNFWKMPKLRTSLIAANVFMFGALIKITFLPWASVLLVVFLVRLFYSRDINFFQDFSNSKFLALAFIVLFALCCDLYGKNLWKYKRVVPFADQVVGHEMAYEHFPIYKRNTVWHKESEGKELMSFPSWFAKYIDAAMQSTLGIQGHRNVGRQLLHIKVYRVLFVFIGLSLLLFLLKMFRKKLFDDPDVTLLGVLTFASLAYSFFVLQNNYNAYVNFSRTFGTALQGRYLFPAVISFTPVLAVVLTQAWPRVTRLPLTFIFAALFTVLGWPVLIQDSRVWASLMSKGAVFNQGLDAAHAYYKPKRASKVVLSQAERADGLLVSKSKWLAQEIVLADSVRVDSIQLFLIAGKAYRISILKTKSDRPGEEVVFKNMIPESSGPVSIEMYFNLEPGVYWLLVAGDDEKGSDVGTSAPGSNPYGGMFLISTNKGLRWEELNRDLYFNFSQYSDNK